MAVAGVVEDSNEGFVDFFRADYETEVTIRFIPQEPGVTGVKILNTGFKTDQFSLKSAMDACCGWENLLCRLKGWLEFGADLRK